MTTELMERTVRDHGWELVASYIGAGHLCQETD